MKRSKQLIYIVSFVVAALLAGTAPRNAFSKSLSELEQIKGYELKGTVFTSSFKPIAIIRNTKTDKISMYQVDEYVGDIKILDIVRGQVILEDNGRQYALGLPSGGMKYIKEEDFQATRVGDTFKLTRLEIQKAISNVRKHIKDIRIRPHFERGLPKGVKIESVKDGSLFDKIGVKSGDIVKSVNGMSLYAPHKVIQAYKKFKDEDSFEVKMVRNGEPLVLNYKID